MNRVLSLLAFCTALAACSTLTPVPAYSQDGMVSLDDVVLLAQSEISDQTILTFLRYRQLDFVLDAKGVQRLREAGVSEDVIQYLLEQDATALAVLPTYVVSSGYRTGYPSYYYGARYYGARFVGITVFPLGWYNHHYFGFGHAADHHGLIHGGARHFGHNSGHVGRHRSVHGGARHVGHNSGHVGRHRSVHGGARHFGHNSGHVGRHRSAHGRGHSGSHHGSHGGGH